MNQNSDFENSDDSYDDLSEMNLLPDETDFDPNKTTQELTAYLDGELGPDEVARIEQRLNEDPLYLAEMQSLQRAWDAFDAIPNDVSGDSFVRTTMEMVVAEAKNSAMSRATSRSSWLRNPILIVLPLCLAMGGFATARYVQTEPHRRLAQNLDLIEKFDRYKMINLDLTYLMRLNQRQLFSDNELFVEELDDLRQVVGGIEKEPNEKRETVGDPKEYLASLGQAEIQRLRVNYDHFTKLNSEELTRMTNFHQQLQSHPDRVPLMKVLDAYYKWLILLGSTEKANLLDLEPEKRLPEIARIRYQQSKTALGRLGATKLPLDRDEEHLLNWFDLTIRSHEPLIRRQFPGILNAYQSQNETTAEVPQEQLARFAEEASIKQLVAILIRIDREYIEDLIHQDIDLLRRGMSYEAQVIIADQAPADQKELVMNWIEAANQAKATIPEEKLQEFYEQLPAEKRDQLDRMSLEEWTSTLSRMYRERNVLFRIEDLEELFLRGS